MTTYVYTIGFTISQPGSYYINVLVSGSSAVLSGSGAKIAITKSSAPYVLSANFTSDLGSVLVVFNQRTNRGGLAFSSAAAGLAQCQALVDSSVVSKLGSGPSCSWVNASALNIRFGYGATLLPTSVSGTGLLFNPNVIYNAAETSGSLFVTPSIYLPANVTGPVAILQAPTLINPCGSFVLDASSSTGGGGRNLTFTWAVTTQTVDPTQLADPSVQLNATNALTAALLAASRPGRLSIPGSIIASGYEVIFTVVATNFLGLTSTAYTTITSTTAPVPLVSLIPGTSITTLASRSVSVEALATPACGSTAPLTYSWVQTDGPSLAVSTTYPALAALFLASAATRTLYIPAGLLTASQSYAFQLTVYPSSQPTAAATQSLQISASPSPLYATILGGNAALPGGRAVTVEASPRDPDVLAAAVDSFTYAWQCSFVAATPASGVVPAATDCFSTAPLLSATIVDGYKVVVPTDASRPNGTFTLTATISKEPIVTGRVISVSTALESVAVQPGTSSYCSQLSVVVGGPVSSSVDPTSRIHLLASRIARIFRCPLALSDFTGICFLFRARCTMPLRARWLRMRPSRTSRGRLSVHPASAFRRLWTADPRGS